MQASDVMTKQVVTVNPDTSVREVARILLSNRISAVPVVDSEGHPLGMLSEGDLMRRAESGTEDRHSWWLSLVADQRAESFVTSHGLHAKDLMTREVISVSEDISLEEVATLLERRRIKRVPVVRDGKLVGIVSRANLLHGLVAQWPRSDYSRDDQKIRAVLIATLEELGLAHHFVNVVVSNGTAQLWGVTQSESERDAVRIAAAATSGVKHVEDHLSVLPDRLRGALGPI
jgi:CBS domain-containing protein